MVKGNPGKNRKRYIAENVFVATLIEHSPIK